MSQEIQEQKMSLQDAFNILQSVIDTSLSQGVFKREGEVLKVYEAKQTILNDFMTLKKSHASLKEELDNKAGISPEKSKVSE